MIQFAILTFFVNSVLAAPSDVVLNDTIAKGAQTSWNYLSPILTSVHKNATGWETLAKPPTVIWPEQESNGIQDQDRLDNIDERGPYVGGDMVLSPDQMQDMKAGIVGTNYRWPGAQIPFVLDGFTQSELNTIGAAMQQIQSKTCIRFVQRTSQRDYIYIVRGASGSGCWSLVGRQGGPQQVNLQFDGCIYPGIAAHELIHAIGYFHEQSRTDRDNYVTIHWENIQQGTESNFDKYPATQVNPYGVSYDYESIMHYSAYAFSKNNLPTIDPIGVPRSVLGQRNNLSAKDAQKINNMYNCPQ